MSQSNERKNKTNSNQSDPSINPIGLREHLIHMIGTLEHVIDPIGAHEGAGRWKSEVSLSRLR